MENCDVYTLGIDIGSTASKCVVLKNGKEIVGKSLVNVGAGTSGPSRAIKEVIEDSGISESDINFVLATGYGRNSVPNANAQMSELSCHAKGSTYLFEDAKTVIDIGGQDAKVLRIGNNGNMETFVMNDKCAAGTGRFLEVMSRILEVDLSDMAKKAEQSTRRVEISSTCTVFAESEVISQLAANTDICDIINGIHHSVAGRTAGLARRVGVTPKVVMSGGVARNEGVVKALQEELNVEIFTSPLTQYTGAIGAAIYAWEKYNK